VLIHECTHQYHYLAKKLRMHGAPIYSEGISEYFASHEWDGKGLRVGLVHHVGNTAMRAEAKRIFEENRKYDLRSVPWRTRSPRYDEAWAIVTFLMEYDRDAFGKWAADLDRGVDPQLVWDEVYGPTMNAVNLAYEQWLMRVCRE
jgi:hypothetical protein